MSEFNVGDTVKVVEFANHIEHPLLGERGTVFEITGAPGDLWIKLIWPTGSAPHKANHTQFMWFKGGEIVKVEEIPHDHDLREAIRTLPGLDNAGLVWNTETDPVEFLKNYGEVLGDMLKYYKKKEAKLEKIAAALEVLYDA